MTTQTDTIKIFDTTLRDGIQAPGFQMTIDQKISMARQLEKLEVDIIEAGFPISSPDKWEAVHKISKNIKNASVTGLARAVEQDIEAAASALKPARKPRIHTFIATSDLHIRHKLQTTHKAVLDQIKQSVHYARRFVDDVEWSAEDASRTNRDYLCRAVETAITAGATTINLPDTVGYADPDEYADMFVHVMNRVPNADRAVFSAHCHDDRGIAVFNSLAAIKAGVRQVECTINGIGERAGNAALEEIVMAMHARPDRYPYNTNINTRHIIPTSKCLTSITGVAPQPNKAITGANAFAHESGIHQDGMLKHEGTYEIISPQSVGAQSSLVIGSDSGKNAMAARLEASGIIIQSNAMHGFYKAVVAHCDENGGIVDDHQFKQIAMRFRPQ